MTAYALSLATYPLRERGRFGLVFREAATGRALDLGDLVRVRTLHPFDVVVVDHARRAEHALLVVGHALANMWLPSEALFESVWNEVDASRRLPPWSEGARVALPLSRGAVPAVVELGANALTAALEARHDAIVWTRTPQSYVFALVGGESPRLSVVLGPERTSAPRVVIGDPAPLPLDLDDAKARDVSPTPEELADVDYDALAALLHVARRLRTLDDRS